MCGLLLGRTQSGAGWHPMPIKYIKYHQNTSHQPVLHDRNRVPPFYFLSLDDVLLFWVHHSLPQCQDAKVNGTTSRNGANVVFPVAADLKSAAATSRPTAKILTLRLQVDPCRPYWTQLEQLPCRAKQRSWRCLRWNRWVVAPTAVATPRRNARAIHRRGSLPGRSLIRLWGGAKPKLRCCTKSFNYTIFLRPAHPSTIFAVLITHMFHDGPISFCSLQTCTVDCEWDAPQLQLLEPRAFPTLPWSPCEVTRHSGSS